MIIETKYDVGNLVWVMYNDMPQQSSVDIVITNTTNKGTKVLYSLFGIPGYLSKEGVFDTKESLLQSL